MNIWIFNHYAIAPGTGGITRHYDMSKQLVKNGHEVTIFASSYDHQSRKELHCKDNKFYKVEMFDGVRYVWIKTFPYKKNDWKRVLNMLSYTFKSFFKSISTKEKPDIIIGSLMHPLAALLGYVISRVKKCDFYFEERDLWPQSLIDLGKVSESHPIVKLLNKLELFLYKKSTRIIVLFDKAVNYVESRGICSNKVIYLPNGVDLDRYKDFGKLPEEFSVFFRENKNKFIAVYTGAHGLANNLEALVDAAKKAREINNKIHFLFVGDGPEKEKLILLSKKENLDNVSFMPAVSKEHIPSILRNSDVALVSMKDAEVYKWGISLNKLFDYMAAQLPIIIHCNIDETPVEKSNSGFKVNTTTEIALKLNALYENKDLRMEKKKNSYEYVFQNHSWEKLSRKLLNEMTR